MAGDAGADQGLVDDELEGKADQDRCEGGQPRPLCRLPDGRGRHPTADVPGDFAMSNSANATAVAIVGAGYVADFYARTLPNHKGIRLAGVYDCDEPRSARFGSRYSVPVFQSLDAVLRSREIPIFVNLTHPISHLVVSRRRLLAGKDVCSGNDLGTADRDAAILPRGADDVGVRLDSEPCNHRGEARETAWKGVRGGLIRRVVVACAVLDDGWGLHLR